MGVWRLLQPCRSGTSVSFIVSPSDGGRTHQWTVAWTRLRLLFLFSAAIFLGILVLIVQNVRMTVEIRDLQRFRSENETLRLQAVRIGELESELSELVSVNDQVRKLAGLASDSLAPGQRRDDLR